MRIVLIVIALVLCVSPRAFGKEPATQPAINAAELLEQVVTQFNSAERMALSYRLDETQLPREVDNDELVKAMYRTLPVSLFLNRPGQLDLRGGMSRAPTRFLVSDNRIVTEIQMPGKDLSVVLYPDPAATVEQAISGRFPAYAWLHDQFMWLLHAEGWRYYFKYATNIRQIGWAKETNGGDQSADCVRLAFEMFDGTKWEMWIESESKALVRLYVRDEVEVQFIDSKSIPQQDGGVLWADDYPDARRKKVAIQRERRIDFESLDFNPTFPPEAFAPPSEEPKPKEEPFPRRPTSVGEAMPTKFGKNASGQPVTLEIAKGQPFVAMSFQPLQRPVPENRLAPTLLLVQMVREELKDPSRIICFVAEDPSQPVKDLLARPEFAGATVVYANLPELTVTTFQGGGIAIVDRNGKITWNGMGGQPMAFPIVIDELRKTLAE